MVGYVLYEQAAYMQRQSRYFKSFRHLLIDTQHSAF